MNENTPLDVYTDVIEEIHLQRREWERELAKAIEAGDRDRGLALMMKLAGVLPVLSHVAWELHPVLLKEK